MSGTAEPDRSAIRDAATVILVRNPAAPEVLMGQRGAGAAFMPSKFVFPGGAVDPGDRAVPLEGLPDPLCMDRLAEDSAPGLAPGLVAAALRELTEETGVTPDLVEVLAKTDDWLTYDLPPELLGKVWGGKYRGQKQKWFLMRFKGTDDQVKIEQPHQEFARWQWLAADEILAAIVPFKRAVYDEVVKAFRPHLA